MKGGTVMKYVHGDVKLELKPLETNYLFTIFSIIIGIIVLNIIKKPEILSEILSNPVFTGLFISFLRR
jgi:hypothetical protein